MLGPTQLEGASAVDWTPQATPRAVLLQGGVTKAAARPQLYWTLRRLPDPGLLASLF